MSGHAQLTYRDLDKAHAFMGDQEDSAVIAVDHPDFYCTKVHGVYRAPLPHLSDREILSHRDVEDALIAGIDGDVETDLDDEDEFDLGCIEDDREDLEALYHAYLAIADTDEDGAWLRGIEEAAEAYAAARPKIVAQPIAFTVLVTEPGAPTSEPEVSGDDDGPTAISGWRASLTDPTVDLRLDNGTGGYACWKDTTKSPTQFMRHAGRIQPTFRRNQVRAA